MREKICTVDRCDRDAVALALCAYHYNNHRAGKPLILPRETVAKETVSDTLDAWGVYDPKTGCLEWSRARSDGYGTMAWGGRTRYVHRMAYVEAYGRIPDGLTVDHQCANRACFNPDHLMAVTHLQNIQHRTRPYPRSKTGLRGVWARPGGRYSAVASVRGVRHFGGTYATAEEAAEAASKLREELGFYSPKIR